MKRRDGVRVQFLSTCVDSIQCWSKIVQPQNPPKPTATTTEPFPLFTQIDFLNPNRSISPHGLPKTSTKSSQSSSLSPPSPPSSSSAKSATRRRSSASSHSPNSSKPSISPKSTGTQSNPLLTKLPLTPISDLRNG